MNKEIEGLNGVYQTIAQITTLEDALVIYQQFKGLTITFPTKLIDSDYVKNYLKKELLSGKHFSSKDIQNLARSFDYSERQLRRFFSEVRKDIQIERVEEQSLPYVSKWLQEQNLEEK
ncbi:hypothetical protein ACQUEF_13510 [Vagococcus fluvialis]|uniref:hypothetical protein n=1 Tax=Vagococcus fluvialis TaxID=2738 RepID=UPI003B5B84B1